MLAMLIKHVHYDLNISYFNSFQTSNGGNIQLSCVNEEDMQINIFEMVHFKSFMEFQFQQAATTEREF